MKSDLFKELNFTYGKDSDVDDKMQKELKDHRS